MGASNSSASQRQYFLLKQKADAQTEPSFAQSEKVNGAWTTTKTFNQMSGHINNLKIEEKDFGKGGKANVFTLIMEDESGEFWIQMPHGNLTYSILNTLASDLDKLATYNIQVYRKQGKSQFGDTVFFPGAFIKREQTQLKWLVDPKETPKGEKIKNAKGEDVMQNGKPMVDYTEQKAYWEKFAQENIISKLSVPTQPSVREQVANNNSAPTQMVADADDLPF